MSENQHHFSSYNSTSSSTFKCFKIQLPVYYLLPLSTYGDVAKHSLNWKHQQIDGLNRGFLAHIHHWGTHYKNLPQSQTTSEHFCLNEQIVSNCIIKTMIRKLLGVQAVKIQQTTYVISGDFIQNFGTKKHPNQKKTGK